MFRELMPLIESRPLSITVAVLTGGLIRVNVVPQQLDKDSKVNDKIGYSNKEKIAKIPESAIYALTTPLSLTGTPEEIDESLPQALTHFAESHVRLQNTVDDAKNQIAEAVRATEERGKNKGKTKSASGGTTDKKEDKKSGSGRTLATLVCIVEQAGRHEPEQPNNDKAVQPELRPVVQPVPDDE